MPAATEIVGATPAIPYHRYRSIQHKARFHATVKPTGAICNLDCACCYLHKQGLPGSYGKFRISDEILETIEWRPRLRTLGFNPASKRRDKADTAEY